MAMIGVLAILTTLFAWRDYRRDADRSGDRLAALAATESRNLERYIQARFQILGAVATSPSFRNARGETIAADLVEVDPQERGFDGGMMWVDASGIVRATTSRSGGFGLDLTDRQYVKDVLSTGEPAVQAVIGRLDEQPVVVLAVPTRGGAGRVNGALLGVFSQQAIGAQLTGLTDGTEEVVVIDDVANIVVGGRTGALDRIDPGSPYGVIRYRQNGVLSSAVGLTGGRDRVIGFSLVPTLDWIVAVSDDRGAVLRPARRAFAQKLAIVIGVVALAVAAMTWELRRARRMRQLADDRRLASSRQRIAASRFIVADNPGTVARTVCHAVEDELGIPWCAIVSAMPDAPTRLLATSGDVPGWVDHVQVDLGELPQAPRGEAARLLPITPIGAGPDAPQVRATRIGSDSASGTRVLIAPYDRDLDEGQRASVSGILESATQAFDRAYLMDRDRRARERTNLLTRLSSEINDVDGVAARTRRLVEVVVPEWADAAVVQSVVEPYETIAARHRVPGRLPAIIAEAQDGVRAVVAREEHRSRRVGRAASDLPEALQAARATLVSDERGTTIIAPLRQRDVVETVLILRREAGRPPFDEDNLEYAELIADRGAVGIDRARRSAHERQVAMELQRSLLPESASEFSDRVRVATRYLPGARELNVGGDWFDASERRDGRLVLVVGDVVGHGLPSAAAMGRLASALRALAISEQSPETTLDALEEFASRTRGATLATVAILVLDAETGDLEYCVAGHPPPLVVHRDGSTDYLWEGRRTPLGVSVPGHDAGGVGRARLSEGDTIVLYSDGVVERRGELIDTSLERLARTARANRDLGPDSMVDAVLGEMLGAVTQSDDAAMLIARIDHVGRRVRFSQPATADGVTKARERIDAWTGEVLPHEDAEAVRLAAAAALSDLAACDGGDDDHLDVELARDRDGAFGVRIARRGTHVAGGPAEDGPALETIRGVMADVRVERREDRVEIDMRGTSSVPATTV